MKKCLVAVICICLTSGVLAQDVPEGTEPAKEDTGMPSVEQILKDAEEAIAKIKDYSGYMTARSRCTRAPSRTSP